MLKTLVLAGSVLAGTLVPVAQKPSNGTGTLCTKQTALIESVHAFCRYYRSGQTVRLFCVNKDGTQLDIIVDTNKA